MKRLSRLFLALGTLMIFSAAGLLLYNRWDSDQAGVHAEQVLEQLESKIPETVSAVRAQNSVLEESSDRDEQPREMTVKAIEGNEYIGYLSIPALDLSLPVLAQWSYAGLKTAPGRFCGSVYTDDLVICAHNYASHFGRLSYLEPATPISFTDMDGEVWNYTLSKTESLSPDALEQMTGTDGDRDWDLTLFTCTPGGQTRAAYRFTLAQMLPG